MYDLSVVNFTSIDDVEAFVQAQGTGAMEALFRAGKLSEPQTAVYVNWLELQRQIDDDRRFDEAHDLSKRQTVAAETAAIAAKNSARWARLSVLIAIAAFAVAAWQYMPWSK